MDKRVGSEPERASQVIQAEKGKGASRPPFTLSLFGGGAVIANGASIVLPNRKGRALIGYLGLCEGQSETRERLVGLFWSESEEWKARASLRQTLRQLRDALAGAGYDGLETGRDIVSLAPGSIAVDVHDILAEAAMGRPHHLLLDVINAPDALFAGLDDLDPAFRVWVLARRQTLRDRILLGLQTTLANQSLQSRDRALAATAVANVDPTNEEAARILMRHHAGAGDSAGALRVYNQLWHLLAEEYDMEPSQATMDLVALIKTGKIEAGEDRAEPERGRASADRPPLSNQGPTGPSPAARIALVLAPIRHSGAHPERTDIVDAFRHQLIACLIRFREWSIFDGAQAEDVISRLAIGSPIYVINTTSITRDDGLRLTITLQDQASGLYVWSESFDLSISRWAEFQQTVVRRIAIVLDVQISSERLVQIASQPDISLTQYERYLRGFAIVNSFDAANWERGLKLFDQTIRDAPNFALGYVSKAQLENSRHVAFPGVFRDRAGHENAWDLSRQSVRLDPVNSRAHLCMAWSCMLTGRFTEGAFHANLAYELNENEPWTLVSAANILSFGGNASRGRQLAEQAVQLNPLPNATQLAYHASVRFIADEPQSCVAYADQAGGAYGGISAWKIAALVELGELARARQELTSMINQLRSRWAGSADPTEDAIVAWVMHIFPIAERQIWERLREDLGRAGAPVSHIRFGEW